MNIFLLSKNPRDAAIWQHDRHVVKMILESTQMLCTVIQDRHSDFMTKWSHIIREAENPADLYKPTHRNHPCTLWAGDAPENFEWLLNHAFDLCDEYRFRFGKTHKSRQLLSLILAYHVKYNDVALMEPIYFPCCMPDEYQKFRSSVANYQLFYIRSKIHQSHVKWTNRGMPKFILSPDIELHQYITQRDWDRINQLKPVQFGTPMTRLRIHN